MINDNNDKRSLSEKLTEILKRIAEKRHSGPPTIWAPLQWKECRRSWLEGIKKALRKRSLRHERHRNREEGR